jgi:DNA-binding XRE family transcriptional regulator
MSLFGQFNHLRPLEPDRADVYDPSALNPEERSVFFRRERANRGLTQEKMAKRIGISRRSWWRAEQGLNLSPPIALRVARYFGYDVTELWPVDKEPVPA